VAIQKSAASEIRTLIADLAAADPAVRDRAAVRLNVIGVRAVPHLLDAFAALPSPSVRATILHALEATGDRRGVDAATSVLHSPAADPKVATAAVRLLGSHLEAGDTERALDTLSALVLDSAYPQALRLEALSELGRVPARVLAPIRKWLAADPDETVRQAATSKSAPQRPPVDPIAGLERAAEGQDVDPATLTGWLGDVAAAISFSTLHRLVEVTRTREDLAPSAADRAEWRVARGAVHVALARRASRVAMYDLRESLERAAGALPDDFIAAAELVGDVSCLAPIVGALASAPIDIEMRDHRRQDALRAAGRAIVQREHLTKRHAAIKKLLKDWPDAAQSVLARP